MGFDARNVSAQQPSKTSSNQSEVNDFEGLRRLPAVKGKEK